MGLIGHGFEHLLQKLSGRGSISRDLLPRNVRDFWFGLFLAKETDDEALEVENTRLKKLLAEQMMDVSMLKEMLGRTSEAWCAAASLGPLPGRRFGQAKSAERRGHDTEGIPAAARLRFGWDRPRVYRRPPTRPEDADLRARLKDLSSERRRFGYPCMMASDNGTELTSNAILEWQEDRKVEWHYRTPGKPMQNGFVESFDGRMRPSCAGKHALPGRG